MLSIQAMLLGRTGTPSGILAVMQLIEPGRVKHKSENVHIYLIKGKYFVEEMYQFFVSR